MVASWSLTANSRIPSYSTAQRRKTSRAALILLQSAVCATLQVGYVTTVALKSGVALPLSPTSPLCQCPLGRLRMPRRDMITRGCQRTEAPTTRYRSSQLRLAQLMTPERVGSLRLRRAPCQARLIASARSTRRSEANASGAKAREAPVFVPACQ